MEKIRDFSKKHSILFCILFTVIYMILFQLAGLLVSKTIKENTLILQTIVDALGAVFAIFVIYKLKLQHILKDKGIGFGRSIVVGLFFVILNVIILFDFLLLKAISSSPDMQNIMKSMGEDVAIFNGNIGFSVIIKILLLSIAVGICEEFIFRGIMTNVIRNQYGNTKTGIYITVFASGLIFGMMHLANVLSGASISGVIIQVICVASLGCYLSAVYVRCNNLWFIAILHAVNDFAAFLLTALMSGNNMGMNAVANSISDYGFSKLFIVIVYLIPTIILLRDSKMKEILKHTEN